MINGILGTIPQWELNENTNIYIYMWKYCEQNVDYFVLTFMCLVIMTQFYAEYMRPEEFMVV